MKFKINLTQLRLPILLSFLLLAFAYSCNDPIEVEQQPMEDLSEEAVFEALQQEVAKIQRENKSSEVGHFNGKTGADLFREQEQSNNSSFRSSTCSNTPDCPFQTINDNYNFGSCVISYSYDRYLCGPGDAAIFNFKITGTSQYCHFYKILVTDNYNDGDLIDYQKYYNYFAAFILSNIEDNLFDFMPAGAGGNSTVISYIPNLCSVVCQSNGAREECGEECCIRYVFHQDSDNSRITFVQSTGECGGTVATCSNPPNQTGDCQNHNCTYLDLYR